MLKYVNTQTITPDTRVGDAPIKLSAPSFKVTVGYKEYYDVYPKYESTEKIWPQGNDFFAFVVGQGMSVIPDKCSGTVYLKEPHDETIWKDYGPLSPSEETITGYSIEGKQLLNTYIPAYIRGNCYFRAEADTSDPTLKISLKYGYDRSGKVSYTIGLNVIFINVAISGSYSDLLQKSNTFYL